MKICFVSSDMTWTGGVQQVCASLTNALVDKHDIYIYGLYATYDKLRYHLDERIQYVEGPKTEYRLRYLIKHNFWSFVKFVKKEKIDVVVLMGNYPAVVLVGTRFFTKAKYVYCDHGALMNQWHQKDITGIRLIDALCSHKTITLTERTKQDYLAKFRLPKRKVQCIYNWMEMPKEVQDYDAESKRIMSVGRFAKEKGYEMLVEMASHVLPKYPEWHWDLYGEGDTFEEIRELVDQFHIGNQLHLMGNMPDVKERYHQYAFLVLTSYREGLPLVLLEAKANKLPLVSFDILTGPRDIITDGKDGFLIEPYDKKKMEDQIEQLILDADLRQQVSKSSAENLYKFQKDIVLSQWEKLFTELVKG